METTPNVALTRLREGNLVLGLSVGLLAVPAMAQLARAAEYHWLAIDMEHSPLGLPEVSQLALAALPLGVTPIVRCRQEALHDGVRALDSGVQGLLVPCIGNAGEARRVVEAVRFSPHGKRSWGGAAPTFGFAPPSPDEGAIELDRQTLIALMIETRDGLEQVDAIAAVAGVDALFVGVVDLSLALGIRPRPEEPALWEALAAVAAACRRHGKFFGVGGLYDERSLPRLIALGARLLAGGSDHGFLLQAAQARARLITALCETAGAA